MNTCCLSCKKGTRNIDPKVIKTKNNRKMMLSRCSICNNKKSTFISQGFLVCLIIYYLIQLKIE